MGAWKERGRRKREEGRERRKIPAPHDTTLVRTRASHANDGTHADDDILRHFFLRGRQQLFSE